MNVGLRAQLKNNRFKDLSKQMLAKEHKARVRAAEVGAAVLKQLAPEDTGNLKSLIAVALGAYGGVRLVSGAWYSLFVFFGTVFQSPHPAWALANEAMRKQLPKEYRKLRVR